MLYLNIMQIINNIEKENILNKVTAYPYTQLKQEFISIILLPTLRCFSKILKDDDDTIDVMLYFDSQPFEVFLESTQERIIEQL